MDSGTLGDGDQLFLNFLKARLGPAIVNDFLAWERQRKASLKGNLPLYARQEQGSMLFDIHILEMEQGPAPDGTSHWPKLEMLVHPGHVLEREGYTTRQLSPEALKAKQKCSRCFLRRFAAFTLLASACLPIHHYPTGILTSAVAHLPARREAAGVYTLIVTDHGRRLRVQTDVASTFEYKSR